MWNQLLIISDLFRDIARWFAEVCRISDELVLLVPTVSCYFNFLKFLSISISSCNFMTRVKMVRLWGWRSLSWRGRRVQHTPTSRWSSEKNTTTSRWSSKNTTTSPWTIASKPSQTTERWGKILYINAQFVAIVLVTTLRKFSLSSKDLLAKCLKVIWWLHMCVTRLSSRGFLTDTALRTTS